MPNRAAFLRLNPAWSLMRCIFAFEICLIHLCGLAIYRPHEGWMIGTVFMSAARTGSVGFLMLAGAILIGRGKDQSGTYLLDRLRRWLPTLLVAQLAYGAVAIWTGVESIETLSWFDIVNPAWYHVWFFYALGVVYLVVVPMRWYAGWAARQPGAAGVMALWGPVAALLAVLGWVTAVHGGFWGDLRPVNLLVYCGYAWTGYALSVSFPRGAAAGAWMLVGGIAATATATLLASAGAESPVSSYLHRCSIFVAFSAMGQFLMLLRANAMSWNAAMAERVHRLARLTLGIFIVHPALIVLGGWPYDWARIGSAEWLSMPLAAIALFAASGLVTWLVLRLLDALRAVGEPVRLRELA